MSLCAQLAAVRSALALPDGPNGAGPVVQVLEPGCVPAPDWPAHTLFFSVSDRHSRARTLHVRAASFDEAWAQGQVAVLALCTAQGWTGDGLWLRVDRVERVRVLSWQGLQQALQRVKRNYFRHGLALDAQCRWAFTEQELNANAMLYAGGGVAHARVNPAHFQRYGRLRHGADFALALAPQDPVFLLGTAGVFCGEDGVVHRLVGEGPGVGRREQPPLRAPDVRALVASGADHLARQVQADGRFVYGHFPCFGREIGTYNALRHASTTYAMAEAWGLLGGEALRAATERALHHLVHTLIVRRTLPDGRAAAFLVDTGGEIKLGGNAAALLALVQHAETTGSREHTALMTELAEGIVFMQDGHSGAFRHVLHADDLSLKEAFRIIYYDGEAAFSLCRLHAFDGQARWLDRVEMAFAHFIDAHHWQAHDHWLAYAVNELTRHRPDPRYFRFGLQNVVGHLDFVLQRQTTFPTLLELMLAARRMLDRLAALPALRHLLDEVDMDKFQRALAHRANHLINGFFWPEMAMFFKRPASVAGAFFIRHQAFRVRIDDIEHHLSGYVAYHRWLSAREAQA